jgi:hypothetical protein
LTLSGFDEADLALFELIQYSNGLAFSSEFFAANNLAFVDIVTMAVDLDHIEIENTERRCLRT